MLLCSIAVLVLVLQNSDGFKIQNKDARKKCGQIGDQLVGYHLRKIFLQAHNEERASLAKGNATTGTGEKFPAAANMQFMGYDCDLEKKAINLTLTCIRYPNKTGFTEADRNFASIDSHEKNGPNKVAGEAVSLWWNQKPHWDKLQRITDTDNSAIPFFLMAQADTDKVGCAVNYCMNDNKFYYTIACFYGKDVKVGSELYEQGITPCTNCTGDCYESLLCKKQ